MNTLRSISFTTIGLAVTACGVTNTDPSLWQQSKDLGGMMYSPMPGAAGEPQGSAGESNMPPQGAGGAPQQGTGDVPPVGGGPPVQGNGGTTGFPQGSGGIPPSAGGFTTGVGGVPPGGGGMPFGAGGSIVGTGGAPMGTGGSTGSGNSGKCTFSFDVTTVTAHGRYAPANVGAIWITDSSNKFVKTLRIWGTIRLSNATAWVQSANSNRTDAVTGATRTSHGALNAKWDCTNTSEAAVPDGMYTVNVTFTESDSIPFLGGSTPTAKVNFTKGAAGDDQKGTDTANFTGMHATVMPAP
jgi:hypothetical protein